MAPYIIDILILLVLAITAWQGYRKGLILTLCGFFALFIAFFGANMITNALTQPVSAMLEPIIEQSIQQLFVKDTAQPHDSSLDDSDPVFFPDESSKEQSAQSEKITPQELIELLRQSSIFRRFADVLQQSINDGIIAATQDIVKTVSGYIAKQVARILLFAASFVLILVLWYLLSHTMDLAFRLPVLFAINRYSGAVLGLVKGVAIIFIICLVFQNSLISQEMLEKSLLLHFFCPKSMAMFLV